MLQKYVTANSAWETAASATGSSGIVIFTVQGADTANINLYRITALNNCKCSRRFIRQCPEYGARCPPSPVRVLILDGTIPSLPANALFTVWRETGQGWEEVASSLSDTTWSDDYSLFASEVSVAEVAYQVTALATGCSCRGLSSSLVSHYGTSHGEYLRTECLYP
ncbi:MAG: hypothetical protein MZV63_61610 [Marinilabiliales bacterium]|nr:hypothetical protein [Marinilabiliales bacterium]